MTPLLNTLLELGHSTSQNLEFAYGTKGGIAFGEETITETNLLEFRRRHPQNIHVHSFTKAKESSETGADWEWHIIGRANTLKMRVQAKRVDKNGKIKRLNQSGKKHASYLQIDLLISDALNHGLLPIYCFYSSEIHRKIWTRNKATSQSIPFESGCLLADAAIVKTVSPSKLNDIEKNCVPWHFLCAQKKFSVSKRPYNLRYLEPKQIERYLEEIEEVESSEAFNKFFPTIDHLNSAEDIADKSRGIHATGLSPLFSIGSEDSYRERKISKLVQIDVRSAEARFGLK